MRVALRNRWIQIAVVGTLLLVTAYNVRYFVRGRRRPSAALSEEIALDTGIGSGRQPRWASRDYAAVRGWDNDPFDPGNAMAAAETPHPSGPHTARPAAWKPPSTVITAVGVSDGIPFAMVGDRILREGDRLGAGMIKEINMSSVFVEYDKGSQRIAIE